MFAFLLRGQELKEMVKMLPPKKQGIIFMENVKVPYIYKKTTQSLDERGDFLTSLNEYLLTMGHIYKRLSIQSIMNNRSATLNTLYITDINKYTRA